MHCIYSNYNVLYYDDKTTAILVKEFEGILQYLFLSVLSCIL